MPNRGTPPGLPLLLLPPLLRLPPLLQQQRFQQKKVKGKEVDRFERFQQAEHEAREREKTRTTSSSKRPAGTSVVGAEKGKGKQTKGKRP